jgi:hypothetical protein
MNIPSDLEMTFANDNADIKSVGVNYRDGETISGFVTKAVFAPLDITLCKHHHSQGENPYHHLDFDRAIKITLLYNNGEAKTFE